MPVDIVIPNVGESVTSGVIASWRRAEGDFVQRDEPVLDLETDKITMEVTAPASGVLHHAAKEGDEVGIGAVVGTVDESAKADGTGAAKSESKPAKSEAKSEAKTEAKAEASPAKESAPAAQGVSATPAPAAASGDRPRATPLAEKMAQELGVDLGRIVGTGASGRIREQDVLAAVQSRGAGGAPGSASAGTPAAAGPSRGVTRERMSPLRQRVAARLVEAQHTAAMLTTFNECDMTAVMELRKRYKESFEKKHGVGLGFMSFFVRAAVNALRAFPLVNASIVTDEDGKPAIEKHDYCDIALAVASPKGLVVPVVRNAEALSFAQIEAKVKDFATRARDGKLELSELQGGTFTITNGGVFGSLLSTPILNPPQSAILGMHAIRNRPVEHPEKPGEIALRPMMYLALSYDHRIVDGAEAVSFLVRIREGIERPERLMLDL
ncbi:MAG: 2-oxoglutarate dehydrogenase complex dihydrolipoyllysine-residue succinyltransferase [Phycisphaerales bacterium]|nr:2-oxoglutarate dehydrogenase complex dihydrolipoyllysine-residue succinyltransferase [Phycisphaerales bacterium]